MLKLDKPPTLNQWAPESMQGSILKQRQRTIWKSSQQNGDNPALTFLNTISSSFSAITVVDVVQLRQWNLALCKVIGPCRWRNQLAPPPLADEKFRNSAKMRIKLICSSRFTCYCCSVTEYTHSENANSFTQWERKIKPVAAHSLTSVKQFARPRNL